MAWMRAVAAWFGVACVSAAVGAEQATAARAETSNFSSSEEAIVVTDALRREVTIHAPVSRVAAFSPFAVDLLLDLGAPPALRPALPGPALDRWAEVPAVPFDHTAGPALEPIVAARPDLVILPSAYAAFVEPLARATGAPVLALDVLSVEDLHRHARTLGHLTARQAEAEAWILARREELAALAALTVTDGATGQASGSEGRSVFAMFGSSHAFYGFTSGSYLGDLVGRVGGRLVAPRADEAARFRGLATISMEEVVAADPDVIVLVRHATTREHAEGLASHPAWGSLRAVREGRVITLPDLFFVTCPGLEPGRSARMVHDAVWGTASAAASAGAP